MIDTITKESVFEDYVKEAFQATTGSLSKWELYDTLKKQIEDFEINYETGVKIIVEVLGI